MEFEYTLADPSPFHSSSSFGSLSHSLSVVEPTLVLPNQLQELLAMQEPNTFEEMQRHFFWTQAFLSASNPMPVASSHFRQTPQQLEVVEEDDTSSSSAPHSPACVELNEEEESVMSSYLNLAPVDHWTPFIKTEPQNQMNFQSSGEGEYKEEAKEVENKFPSIWSIKTQQPNNSFSFSAPAALPPSPPPVMPSSSPRSTPVPQPSFNQMQSFPPDEMEHWKHVIYNLLVENHNSPTKDTLVQPCEVVVNGKTLNGFKFNEKQDPGKRLAELYTLHVRKAKLKLETDQTVLIDDLYKFYLRAAYQLLSQYFEKVGKWTYVYRDEPLFVPNETLEEARKRLDSLTTKKKRKCNSVRDKKKKKRSNSKFGTW